MCNIYIGGSIVFYAYGDEGVEPEKRQVCNIILTYLLVLQVCVYKPQPPERPSSYRIIRQFRDKNTLCITNDYICYVPIAVCQNPYLPACSSRTFG